jgi:acyl-coenzyme A synthetase/AMP-(fatty) acid ligase
VWSGDTVVRRNGLLYFVGRNDEMIKTSGNRVSPTEIEEAVFATGAVSAVAAFGVPDERLGQVIVVVASPAAGRTAAEAEALARTALPRTVPAYMLPRDYHWRDALPLGANGKLDRVALRAELAA